MSGVGSVNKWLESANLEKGEPEIADFEGWGFAKAEVRELLSTYEKWGYIHYKINLNNMQEIKRLRGEKKPTVLTKGNKEYSNMSGVESVKKWLESADLEEGEPKKSDFEGWDFTKAEVQEMLSYYEKWGYTQYKIRLITMQDTKKYKKAADAMEKGRWGRGGFSSESFDNSPGYVYHPDPSWDFGDSSSVSDSSDSSFPR